MELQKQRLLVPNIFQYEALNELDKFERENKGGVVIMPTASGKTYLASLWFKKKLEINPEAKLLFICHNKDILSQANEEEFQNCLKDLDITYGYYNADEKYIQQATFGTVQTLARSLKKFNINQFDYIIVDECHHYQADSFKKVIEYFKPKFILGLTATPYRMDNRNIFALIGDKIYEAKISDGIKKDILTKIIYYCVDNDIDFSNIKWNGSGYDEKDLNRKICIKEYDEAILKEYKKSVEEKFKKDKTICFCATVEHVHRMAKYFNDNGIKSIGLTGRHRLKEDVYPRAMRKDIINNFKNGEYKVIFVRDLFNEGVNIPDADCVMLLRPTRSHTIFTQQVGRGLRKAEGKDSVLILDFTGNARRCIINFEVLSEMMDLDILKKIKKSNSNEWKERGEIILLNNGCEVRLTSKKINILRDIGRGYSKERIKDIYNEVKKKLGRQPTGKEFEKLGVSMTAIIRYWNNWSDFLKEVGGIISPELLNRGLTEEDIIKEYYRLKKELGRIPMSVDFCYKNKKARFSEKVIRKRYGTFNNFLKSLNEPTLCEMRDNRFSKEDLIKIYSDLKKEGIEITQHNFLKKTNTSSTIFKKYFGSWNNLLRYVGESPKTNIQKEDIIKDYERVKKKLGKVPSQKEYDKMSDYTHGVMKRFGNYGNFLKEVGDLGKHPYLSGRLVTKQKIIDDYLNLVGRGEYVPFCEFSKISGHNQTRIENFFGGYNHLLKLCDVRNVHRIKVTETERDLKEDYINVKNKLNRPPKVNELNKIGKFPFSSYVKLFGNYGNFLKEVGDYDLFVNTKREVSLKNLRKILSNKYPFEKLKDSYLKSEEDITFKEFLSNNKIGERTFNNLFSSWKDFKGKCNTEKNKENINIISKYKPKTIIIPVRQNRKGIKKNYEGLHKQEFKSKGDKVEIRNKIISKIQDGDNVLLLESPDLSALREIERLGIKPNRIVIPNNLEFKKLSEALREYKTNLKIECINTSALQYLVDSEEKFNFIWLDYCGAFTYYMKDLDILFQKHIKNMKLILTYNLFDPAKDDENYYFTRVIDYVLDKISGKSKVRLINDVTYRYKRNMYNIGFNIEEAKAN